MGATKETLTVEEMKVLFYVKLLEEYEDPENPEATLGQKLDTYTCEPLGMDWLEFEGILEKFCALGILEYDDLNDMYELTDSGKKKIKKLEWMEKLSDEAVTNIHNGAVGVGNFIEKHGVDIMLKVAEIVFGRG